VAHNQKTQARYHQNKPPGVRKPTVDSQYKGVYKCEGGPDLWKVVCLRTVKGVGGSKRTRAEDGPFDTEVKAARAWDTLRSSEAGVPQARAAQLSGRVRRRSGRGGGCGSSGVRR
jgi:hypothetical protein